MDNKGLTKAEEDVSLPPYYSEGEQNCQPGSTPATIYGQPVTTTGGHNVSMQTFQQQPYTLPYGEQFGQTTQTAVVVSQPGQAVAAVVEAPRNHASFAWVACFCFFWPLGLVAILKSREVDSAMMYGDINRAVRASRNARQYSWYSVAVGTVIYMAIAVFVWTQYTYQDSVKQINQIVKG